jgi:hypothetical protein
MLGDSGIGWEAFVPPHVPPHPQSPPLWQGWDAGVCAVGTCVTGENQSVTGGSIETSEPFAFTASPLLIGAFGIVGADTGAKPMPPGKIPAENGPIGIIISLLLHYGSTIHSISNMLMAVVLSNTTSPT